MNPLPWMLQWNMLPETNGTILCAVSGGRDSICLLHYLYTIAQERHFHVAAAHFNHLMRTTAQRDVDFVQGFCQERGIPFYLGATPVYTYAEEKGVGVEEAGRLLRYEFLERTAKEIGASRIATAHHQGDQAETVLLNLLRGTGPEGLSGIPAVRGMYVRPLLQTTREEIEAYLESFGIGHVEDETNTSLDFARNRLRLEIWPELKKINPALRENIARTAEIVRSENEFLNSLAREKIPEQGSKMEASILLAQPKVLQMRMIRMLMERLPSGKKDVGQIHYEAVAQLAQTGGMLNLPGHMKAVCRAGELEILMEEEPACNDVILNIGSMSWKSWTITVTGAEAEEEAIWCKKSDQLSVRAWKREDRLYLTQSRGERSLKRLFQDHGIPPEKREQMPVICLNDKAVFVPGIGMDRSVERSTEKEIGYQIKMLEI